MENAISMERRLASAQLRPLLGAYLDEGLDGEDLALFDRLLVQLAGGVDAHISADALNTLLLKLEEGDQIQITLLELYLQQKALDVVSIRDGEFVWVPTVGYQEEASNG
jgi:hypothetical protein